jgi:hypothetical protein
LLLDGGLLGGPGARERTIAIVSAVRGLNLPGVLRMADLVEHAGRVWLITETAAAPTVDALVEPGAGGWSGVAVLLAADTAQTLSRLHAAGLAHGAFGPATTVLTSAGTASLVEVGLAAALDGTGPDQGGDVAAWAGFVRTLAAACGDPAVTRLLEAGADVAGRTGLPSALRLLSSSVASLPAAPDRLASG